MKDSYENCYRISLPRRTNVIIRIDGKAFHTYTKGLNRPIDHGLTDDMNETAKFLCENIQGAKFGYVQSDEISILLTDYDETDTQAWFDHNLQKMCSIAASTATARFNQLRVSRKFADTTVDPIEHGPTAYDQTISAAINSKLAMFDARVFVIPDQEEVVNYFIWRQQDATRNSISMAAQSLFSHKALHGKSSSQMQDMMMEKKVNWNNYPVGFKRGRAIVKVEKKFIAKDFAHFNGKSHTIDPSSVIIRKEWEVQNPPIFTQERNYIKRNFVKYEESLEDSMDETLS